MKPAYLLAQTGLLASSYLLMAASSYATSTANNPIIISLQQTTDQNCDGQADEGVQLPTPNSCIIYTVVATNISHKRIFNIRLSGKIPTYTKLYSPLKGNMQLVRSDEGELLVQSLFNPLEPGEEHSAIMRYVVQIL